MIRFLFRFLAMLALAVAVIMAVVDATRTIAAAQLVLTPLSTSWATASPETLAALRAVVADKAHPLLWDPVLVTILAQPGAAIFAILALVFYAIGHKPTRRAERLIFEN